MSGSYQCNSLVFIALCLFTTSKQFTEQFQDGWNHHGIRTANYKSPYQIFTDGALELQQSGLHSLDFFLNVNENYGFEELGLSPEEAGNQMVSIYDLQ